jgi:DNA-binding transcriptional LysR family regulator
MESLRGIVAFVRTVSAGSFSEAARQLGVTTVAVSRNVQRLERELGVRLLQRTTRSLGMTEEGRRLFEATRHALCTLETAHEAIAERRSEPSGLVRILSMTAFSRLYVVPLLAALRARYPRLSLELNASDRIVDMVEEGFDVGIRIGKPTDGNVVVRKLADVPRAVCASRDYLARRGAPQTLADLPNHDAIAYRSPSSGRIVKWEFGDLAGAELPQANAVLTLNDMVAVCDAAVAGHGLVQLPTYIATPALRAGLLAPVLTNVESTPAQLMLHYPSRPLTPARVRVVVDFLYERLHAHPDLTLDPRALGAEAGASARAPADRAAREKTEAATA